METFVVNGGMLGGEPTCTDFTGRRTGGPDCQCSACRRERLTGGTDCDCATCRAARLTVHDLRHMTSNPYALTANEQADVLDLAEARKSYDPLYVGNAQSQRAATANADDVLDLAEARKSYDPIYTGR